LATLDLNEWMVHNFGNIRFKRMDGSQLGKKI